MSLPAVGAVALVVSVLATPVAMVVARRAGVVDRPGALKTQDAPVPYLGGVAVFVGLVVGAAVGRPTVLVPLALALALGVADDRLDVPPHLRVAGEVVIGIAVVLTCPVRLAGWAGTPALVVVTLLLINGVNLLDGLDVLAGGVTAIAATAFAGIVHGPGQALAVALALSLVGFLVYNRPPARIYLGDGGSYLCGTALAVLLASAWAPGVAAPVGTAALALVAVPAAEVACAVVRRRRGRRSLSAGDRGHPYDRLVARGWPRPAASSAYLAVQAVVALVSVLVARHAGLGVAVGLDVAVAVALLALAGLAGGLSPDREAPA